MFNDTVISDSQEISKEDAHLVYAIEVGDATVYVGRIKEKWEKHRGGAHRLRWPEGSFVVVRRGLTKEQAMSLEKEVIAQCVQDGHPLENKYLMPERGPNIKSDNNKDPMGDLPLGALRVTSRVFGYGNVKYEYDNFLRRDVATIRRYVGACLRHLEARQRGERLDPESGLPHLAHAVASLLIALQHEEGPPEALDKGMWE